MTILTIVLGFVLVGLAAAIALVIAGVVDGATAKGVTCPRDGSEATVHVDKETALLTIMTGEPDQIADCSHWPERQGCNRACEKQLG